MLLTEKLTIGEKYKLPYLGDVLDGRALPQDSYSALMDCLRLILTSLFTKFKRTFLLIDGLDEIYETRASR